MAEAARRGYRYGHPDWCNLGQGQPETGPLPGAPPRVHHVEIGVGRPGVRAGARASGSCAARWPSCTTSCTAQGKQSQYTERNVCICGGGRASLTRAVAALGEVNLGHFLPDYTAYEELLDIFKLFTSIPILLEGATGYHFGARRARARDHRPRALGAAALQSVQSDGQGHPGRRAGGMGRARARAALHAADRRVLLALHLGRRTTDRAWSRRRDTWRTWTPIRSCCSTGSPRTGAIPVGGPPGSSGPQAGDRGGVEQRLLPRRRRQQAAAAIRRALALSVGGLRAETAAIRNAFLRKRQILGDGLAGPRACDSTSSPRAPSTGGATYRRCRRRSTPGCRSFGAALEHQVICVPGEFFDVNPGKRRSGRPSRFRNYVRFSFGPEEAAVVEGVRRLGAMVTDAGRVPS